MPIISFQKNRPSMEVPSGSNLMEVLLNVDIPVASSCHGDGVCAKCKIIITEGAEHLSKPNDLEEFLKERHKIPAGVRLSCQVQVHGDIKIDTTYW